jgi:hypothetical protein
MLLLSGNTNRALENGLLKGKVSETGGAIRGLLYGSAETVSIKSTIDQMA